MWSIIILGTMAVILIIANAIHNQNKEEARMRALRITDIDNMDGWTFEHYIGWVLSHQGFTEIRVTQSSGDYGADIIATQNGVKYAIQVKRMSKNVSRRAISDAVAAARHYKCEGAMVITNSYFSENAKIFAKSLSCVLIDRDTLLTWLSSFVLEEKYLTDPPIKLDNKLNQNILSICSQDESSEIRIPDHINRIIVGFAKKESPKDLKRQAAIIESEQNAYKDLVGCKNEIPDSVFTEISNIAVSEWPSEISMQLYTVKNQIDSYKMVQEFSQDGVSESIVNKFKKFAMEEWPGDYDMQLHTIKEQIEKYKESRFRW